MDLPDILLILIAVAIAGAVLVAVAMNRRRDHALRDRFAEEYDRVRHSHARRDRRP